MTSGRVNDGPRRLGCCRIGGSLFLRGDILLGLVSRLGLGSTLSLGTRLGLARRLRPRYDGGLRDDEQLGLDLGLVRRLEVGDRHRLGDEGRTELEDGSLVRGGRAYDGRLGVAL